MPGLGNAGADSLRRLQQAMPDRQHHLVLLTQVRWFPAHQERGTLRGIRETPLLDRQQPGGDQRIQEACQPLGVHPERSGDLLSAPRTIPERGPHTELHPRQQSHARGDATYQAGNRRRLYRRLRGWHDRSLALLVEGWRGHGVAPS